VTYAPLFTAAEIADMRAEEEAAMQHVYTRISAVEGADDAWYDSTVSYGIPVPGLPCLLRITLDTVNTVVSEPVSGDQRVIERETLVIPLGDPLDTGDTVANIRHSITDEMMGRESYTVESVVTVGGDMPTFKMASLRGGSSAPITAPGTSGQWVFMTPHQVVEV
jgi:hypothetical protein